MMKTGNVHQVFSSSPDSMTAYDELTHTLSPASQTGDANYEDSEGRRCCRSALNFDQGFIPLLTRGSR